MRKITIFVIFLLGKNCTDCLAVALQEWAIKFDAFVVVFNQG